MSSTGTLAQISVVGAGNWLISHDRVGPRVLELLEGRYGPEVDLCHTGTSGLELLDHLHGQKLFLVVDACTLGGPAGTLRIVDRPDLSQAPASTASVHQIGPLEALAVAHHLFPEQLPCHIQLILAETEGIDDKLFERVCRDAVDHVDQQIREALALDAAGVEVAQA